MSRATPSDLQRRAASMSALQLAFAADRARAELELAGAEPIAVVGIGCRFPGGANSPAALAELLFAGRDVVGPIPASRWSIADHFDPEPGVPGRMYVREGAFLDDVAGFDPLFFGISPREAASMDPQQRLLLEVGWEALEHAGLPPSTLRGSPTGVWIGAMHHDYAELMAASCIGDASVGTGGGPSVLAGRLSHALGLRGPCMTVDTACSSSLVATHLAIRSLRNRECELAMVGGVNLVLSPLTTIVECQMRMLSPSGRCRSFDAAADGFVRGEGCAMIVLERLVDAIANDHRVLAIVRGSAVNHDGASAGLTVPNGDAQVGVIQAALRDACVLPSQLGYVEAHGTGTALGDPIELAALGRVFADVPSSGEPVWVGSIKTNFGHTEGAAGIAGLIKLVLALGRRELPASLHFHTPTSHVDWDALPIRVVDRARPMVARAGRWLAGVSSFGFSGTNAHVILEAAELELDESPVCARRPLPLLFSASTAAGLRRTLAANAELLADSPALALADLAGTSACRRDARRERAVILADSIAELRDALLDDAHPARVRGRAGAPPKLAWVLAGVAPTLSRWPEPGPLHASVLAELRERSVEAEPLDAELLDALADLRVLERWGLAPHVILAFAGGERLAAAACEGAPVLLADGRERESAELLADLLDPPTLALGPARAALAACDALVVFGEVPAELSAGFERIDPRAWSSLAPALARLHCAGLPLDWQAILGGRGRLIDLPTQVFDRSRHWFTPSLPTARTDAGAPLLGHALELPGLDQHRFTARLAADPGAWWSDRRVADARVQLPRTALIAGLWSALAELGRPAALVELELAPIPALALGASLELHTIVAGESVEILARGPGEAWQSLAKARIASDEPWPVSGSLAALQARLGPAIDLDELRDRSAAQGIELGPRLRCLEVAWSLVPEPDSSGPSWLARLRLPERVAITTTATTSIHPLLLDAIAQLSPALGGGGELRAIRRAALFAVAGPDLWLHVRQLALGIDVELLDSDPARGPIARLEGVELEPCADFDGVVETRWRTRPEPDPSGAPTRDPNAHTLIVGEGEFAATLAAAIVRAGGSARVAPIDLDSLAATIEQASTLDELVLVGDLDPGEGERVDLRAAESLACDVLRPMIAAAARRASPPRLRVITRGAIAVGHDAPLSASGLAAALVRGIVDVARVELPRLHATQIDLDPDHLAAAQLDMLVRELARLREPSFETTLALREGRVMVPRLVARAAPRARWSPRASAWYVVSGGLGGLGWAVVNWLIEAGADRVALLGRTPPSPARAAELDALRSGGIVIEWFVIDVADGPGLERVFAELRARAPLRGVIHCAGLVADGGLDTIDRARFALPFAAKLHGSWALHRASASDELDVFVMFGSAAAALANPGQANYAAANGFEAALAAHRRALGRPALTVDWGPWSDIGMAADRLAGFERRGLRPIARTRGLELLAGLIAEGVAHVGVIPRDAERMRELAGALLPGHLRELLPGTAASFDHAAIRAVLQLPFAEAQARVVAMIGERLAALLRWPGERELASDLPLTALGLDSLVAIELRNQLAGVFRVELDVAGLSSGVSLNDVANDVLERLALTRMRERASAELEEVVL
ncbi:beta-ketoacyl synthase N-terminal-like domain-containing protein [Nannocystaceae bacterium ST9]